MKIIRFIFTVVGLWICALALLGLVLDGVRSIAANEVVTKSLGITWTELGADSLEASKAFITQNLHPFVWDPVFLWILSMPGWLIAALIGLLFLYIGRKRRPKVIRI